MDIAHRKTMLKALKIAVGSVLAIIIAELLQLSYATSAGIIMLLSVQNTRKDTIHLAIERFLSFLLSVCLIFLCFHLPVRSWMSFGLYILLMVLCCYYTGWQNTISVNAVMGTHYMMSPDYSMEFVMSELALVLIGTGLALVMNWKMPSNVKTIYEDMEKIEDEMQQILRELAHHLSGDLRGERIWLDLDRLESHLKKGLEGAREQAHNTMKEEDMYYVEYMEMRSRQCSLLRALRRHAFRIRALPKQAKPVSQYLEYLAGYVHEKNVPEEQIEKLGQVFEHMEQEELPCSRKEFENRATLYHVLVDLEEFLLVKRRFLEKNRPES